MKNNTIPPEQNEFKRPVNIFEAIAQSSENNTGQDTPKKAEKPTTKEKGKGDFLFPIGMLF